MASLVDLYQSHSGRPPPPNPLLRPRAPCCIAQEMCHHIFDRSGPLACKTHKPFPLCRQWYLQPAPADAAAFAMFRSGHLPAPSLDGLYGLPDSPAPATPHTDSTCPWCHFEVTLSAMTSSARDLPLLHIIHRLLLCPAGHGRPPLFKLCSEMLLWILDWPYYHCHLGIFFADLNITPPPPSAPASSCKPSAPLNNAYDFLCLHADPLGFKDPPSEFPVAERTQRWLQMLAVGASFLRRKCPAFSHASPSHPPAHTCSTPCTCSALHTPLLPQTAPLASVTSVLLGSPVVSPQLPPRSRNFACSPQVSCVSDTPDQISDD
jgi:hypothetical protein